MLKIHWLKQEFALRGIQAHANKALMLGRE